MSAGTKVQLGSHVALVPFRGVPVPIGFIASFHKKHHAVCKDKLGFIVTKGKTGPINSVCKCAVPRADKKFRQIGGEGFKELANAWLKAETVRLDKDQRRCLQEGFDASSDDPCPYPNLTDQALAWREGREICQLGGMLPGTLS